MAEAEPPPASPGAHVPESGANSEFNNINENLSAEKHGSQSKNKVVFNLQDAFQRKLQSQEKYLNQISKKKWSFSNCCIVSFEKTSNFRADQVFKSIKQALSEAEYSAIQAIGQYASTKNWTIQFKCELAFKTSLNKEIKIGDVLAVLKDANEFGSSIEPIERRVYKMTAFFRIHWLPSNFFESDIEKFVRQSASFLTIMDIKREKSFIDDKIDNGIFKLKVEYDVKFHQKILDFAGLHVLFGLNALFQLCGMPVKCLYCKTFGHVRKNCPKANSFCISCKRNGHESSKCTMANRTALTDQNLVNLDEDIVADIPVETTPSSSSNLNLNSNPSIIFEKSVSETIDDVIKFKVPETNPEQTIEIKKEAIYSKFVTKFAAEKAEKEKKSLAKKEEKSCTKKNRRRNTV